MKVEDYSQELLDLISEYEEKLLEEWIDNGYFIQSIVFIHRHISAQLRYLIIKSYNKKPEIRMSKEFAEILKDIEDDCLNKVVYIHSFVEKGDLTYLNSLNNLRNNFVHPSKKRKNYTETQIRQLISECMKIQNKLSSQIP